MKLVCLPAALLACVLRLSAAPADPLPLGDDLRATFDEKGVWQINGEVAPVLSQCGLRFWTRGGFLRQSNARATAPPADTAAGRTFEGRLRAGSLSIRYWQTATAVPNGLLVQYAVAAPGLTEKERVAVGLDLPVAVGRGGACWTSAKDRVAFPPEKAPEPYLVDAEAAALHIQRGKLRFTLQRRRTGKIIVQDGRHWGNHAYQAHLYAVHAPDDPEGWLSLSFLLTPGPPVRKPLIGAVVPAGETIACGEPYETEIVLWAPHSNPFLPEQVRAWAELTAPSGATERVAAFYTRDFTRSRADETERLGPAGHGRWLLRFTPTEVGEHRFVVHVASPGGAATSAPRTFRATRRSGQRFLRAPTGRAFRTPDGAPLLLVGYNHCWPGSQAPTYEMEQALDRMARGGVNATRLWLCSWGIGLEGGRPDSYDLADAWRLDQVLRRARARGIYVQICLDNLADLASAKRASTNPYLASNGGPCRKPAEFFTSPRARAQYRRRLEYLAARYACFTSVLAWELCNELDYAAGGRRDAAILTWARESARHLKSVDPYGHPVTVGIGPRSSWNALWELDAIDVIQAHTYIHKPVSVRDEAELDAAALVLRTADHHVRAGKPLLIAEFGFLGTRDFNPLNEADRTGIHLHNALWASALGGCAGTALAWWWDTSLREHNLAYHYAALSAFLRAGPVPASDWKPIRDADKGAVRVVGSRGSAAAVLWVQHRDNRWYRRLVEEKDPPALDAVAVTLTDMRPGRYRIEWWDTYTGQPTTHAIREAADGRLSLVTPRGAPDVACRVQRLDD